MTVYSQNVKETMTIKWNRRDSRGCFNNWRRLERQGLEGQEMKAGR